MTEVIIKTDEDAFDILQKALDGDFTQDDWDNIDLKFEGWPKLHIYLKGDKFNSSLTTSMMNGFIELQKGINRSYCLVNYNTPNTRVLSKEERESLEIQVEVREGSTNTNIDLQGLLTNISGNIINKMTPEMITITIISLGLIWAGKVSYGKYLDNRKEIRETEVKSEETRELLNNQKFLSEQETKRSEILSQAMLKNTQVMSIASVAHDSQSALIKELGKTSSASIQGIDIDGSVAAELAKNARRKSLDIRLDGLFRILNVDSSDPNEFKVKLKNIKTKEEFGAKVQDASLDLRYIKALQHGEWNRVPIKLMVNAKSINDEIRSAIVIEATIPEND